MNIKAWKYIVVFLLLCLVDSAKAQKFFNLTADEVKVDSVLPRFVYSKPLEGRYQDSIYTATVKYAQYVDMTPSSIAHYNRISGAALPSQVVVNQDISVCRRKGTLIVSFCPLVFRKGKYQVLASFMLDIKSKAVGSARTRSAEYNLDLQATDTYAAHSVLAQGRWAKIRVSETGIHQLTEQTIRQAGFSDINKVKIYGYGGNQLPEALYAKDLLASDDLQEVPQCVIAGKHLFFAKGPVSWSSAQAARRTRNPYSDYGYYFITQADEASASIDSLALMQMCQADYSLYHSLYEVDGYSWYPGGRNLFDVTPIAVGGSKDVVIENMTADANGKLSVNVSAGTACMVQVLKNGTPLGTLNITIENSYAKGGEASATYDITDFKVGGKDTISIQTLSGGPARLDYVSVAWSQPRRIPDLQADLPSAEYVYNITNQDHHADGAADMVIIIPTSQKLLAQAQRLKAFHESHDGLRVNIVPADELYNEFSSGTPDAGAYRKYLRMLQDRATSEADMPKYLLLFGDCVWDNRMLTQECKSLNPDDYLLCYESENSFSEIYCYVSDSWLGIISEGAGGNPLGEQQDVAVGRFPVTTEKEAQVMVDKTINYMTNDNAGAWQNSLVFMGDDGNNNLHMRDENEVADYISGLYPAFLTKKVMWDAYTRETSSVGNTYPEVTRLLKQQQANGALIMDYAGHASKTQLSHEAVLTLNDFADFRNSNLPLWVTAACDVMPFDGVEPTIGEAALLNEKGGALAFYGTTRTVYADRNKYMNRAFLRRVLSLQDGKPITIGEAHRLAQNDLLKGVVLDYDEDGKPTKAESDRTENRLQYSLLGDPALSLNLPMAEVKVDSINGVALDEAQEMPTLKAGSVVKVVGHVENAPSFDGVVTATVRDSKQVVTCKLNDATDAGADEAFEYEDRPNVLFQGSDSVVGGKFALTFAIPKDINYSDESGMMNFYAIDNAKQQRAHGYCEAFKVGGSVEVPTDSIGPSIYCYLNSPSFVDGGNVNTTPYFVAEIKDKDGINAAGSGIGHDLQLVIDGDMSKTYNLNDHFIYDFGTYTSGSTYYSIPELAPGNHQLQFRAWDMQNNSSTVTLNFQVVKALKPTLFDVGVTENPAKNIVTFIISHDRAESNMDVVLEVYDLAGRMLWSHAENGVPTSASYTLKWDLSTGGGKLRTGLYIYRVKVATDGSGYVSKTKKLIVIND